MELSIALMILFNTAINDGGKFQKSYKEIYPKELVLSLEHLTLYFLIWILFGVMVKYQLSCMINVLIFVFLLNTYQPEFYSKRPSSVFRER